MHGRAARALANQALPFSACTILRDEEVYSAITPEQEEKDRNARSRYNGRLFLSWLQDVDDKWEKIKVCVIYNLYLMNCLGKSTLIGLGNILKALRKNYNRFCKVTLGKQNKAPTTLNNYGRVTKYHLSQQFLVAFTLTKILVARVLTGGFCRYRKITKSCNIRCG